MAEVGCLSFIASVSPLTSAIIPLAGSLLQQIIIQFDNAVTKGQALRLYGIGDFTHDIDVWYLMTKN